MPYRVYTCDFSSDRKLTATALEICRSEKPDVIHAQHFQAIEVGCMISTIFKIPLVLTLHVPPRVVQQGHVVEDAMVARTHCACKNRSIVAFVAFSEAMERFLVACGASRGKVRTIYHGIPVDAFKREVDAAPGLGLPIPAEHRVVLCPARYSEEKGLETFIRAAVSLDDYPDVSFLLAGRARNSKQREYLEFLSALIPESMSTRFHFKHFERDSMPTVYSRASVCVLPSFQEGLGQVLLEALASGAPVIASDVGGIPEIIEHGENGLIFPVGSSDQLAAHLRTVLQDRRVAVRLRRAGRALAKERFSHTRMAKEHIRLYEDVLASRRRKR